MEPMKVYIVKTAFEHDGLSYAEGEKYELADSIVLQLPEGSVEEFVPEAKEEDSTPVPEPAKPAKPWVGNHTVGRD